jgi:hypothetical protein
MRAIAMTRMDGGRRRKALVADWPEPPPPTANQVKLRASTSLPL